MEWSLRTCFSEQSYQGTFPTAYVDVSTTKFIFASYLLRPVSLKNLRNLLRRFQKTSVPAPNEPHIVNLKYVELQLDFWCAASVRLAQASLSLSSWYWQCWQPDWTPSQRGARACAPGYCLWSLQSQEPNSAARCTLGFLWVQYRGQWSACSNDANLALVVLERLLQMLETYHHCLICRRLGRKRVWIQSVLGSRHVVGGKKNVEWIQ